MLRQPSAAGYSHFASGARLIRALVMRAFGASHKKIRSILRREGAILLAAYLCDARINFAGQRRLGCYDECENGRARRQGAALGRFFL
jgi:hypothetical protein